MSEEFGYWWPAGYEDHKVAGKLVPGDIGATLHLAFDSSIVGQGALFSVVKGVYGLTSSKKKITLLDFFETKSTGDASGTISKEFHANEVLSGAHVPIDDVEAATFKSATLCCSSLRVLFGKTGFSVERPDDNHRSMCLRYSPPSTIEVNLASGLKVKLSYTLDKYIYPGVQTESIDVSELLFVHLTPESPQRLDYFLGVIPELRDFFSLCNGEYCPPSCLSLVANFGEERLDTGEVIYPTISLPINYVYKPESHKALHPREIFIPYQEISETLSSALSNWHEKAEKLAPVRSLYFSALYTDRTNYEANFLALSQAIEVFHRRFRKGTILPKSDFKTGVRKLLWDALEKHPNQEKLSIFRQRIGYLNEYSLRERISELFSEHDTVISAYIGEWPIIAKRIAEARNYYTHYTVGEKGKPPSFRDLLEYINSLSLLISLCLLKESGVPIEALHSQALKSQKYKWMFSGFRKIAEET